ncbi:MAG: exodeoxyribonuclease III [Pseudomonadota bacterium]|nr:exodeoxyribonuclease III [Pseudomonadota bacterium]
MRLVSFNVNGVRARPHQLQRLVEGLRPDVIGLQETKVADDQFPREAIESLGYEAHYHGQKGHYGVALLSRVPAQQVQCGFPNDGEDAQRRIIHGAFLLADGAVVHVANGYFPQGESRAHPIKFPAKQKFYADLVAYLGPRVGRGEHWVVMGDFNISATDLDIGIGEENRKRWLRTGKCSFLPEERGWFQSLLELGFQDSYRLLYPDVSDRFSWFDYRSGGFERDPKRGLRIDGILVSDGLAGRVVGAGIDYELRAMERPSDHCPVWCDLGV